ncbi:HAD-IA family hydrolase [Candidatus Woesearchaeota archaeon]|nr:HAD-IA family hydrolase [Candidatus Woesearchaeota archaeon]
MIKTILFDLDGTLWHSENCIAEAIFNTILDSGGKNINQEDVFTKLRKGASFTSILSEFRIMSLNKYWKFYASNLDKIRLFFENTQETMKVLKSNDKKIGFVTSLKKEFAFKLLNQFNLLRYGDVIVTPSETRARKPSPKPLLIAINYLKGDVENTIYIGDQDVDILAAKNAGCLSGLVLWHNNNKIKEKPDFSFNKLSDIISL